MSTKRMLGFASLFLVLSLLSLLPLVLAVEPFGATVTVTNISRSPVDPADTEVAFAGNISEMTVLGYSVTQSWQGYYGNISGTIQLADGSDFVMYNWSSVNPRGEIYASTNSSIQWLNVQCFNYTSVGDYTGEGANGGTTSLYGTNLSQLEAEFGVNGTDVDGVDETFTLTGAGTHDIFYTANQQFSEGECISTRVYDNTGTGVSNKFEEVLLYEPVSTSVIFTSLIENDEADFNTGTADFEMLVLEDGHGVNVATTPYYFFVELE